MEQNLDTIMNLVENLVTDYNSHTTQPSSSLENGGSNYTSPIGDRLREELQQQLHRPIKGTFVAIARSEIEDVGKYKGFKAITVHNRDVLNNRSESYDSKGNPLFFSESFREQQHRRLSFFECGEGWLDHAFYKNVSLQQKVFTRQKSIAKNPSKDYGLYHRYGRQAIRSVTNNDTDDDENYPLLPLPFNYYGDILPSMLNFWLAVQADVFVGVKKSSWSTSVWTTRYHKGKGDRNFEYTRDRGIIPIENNGLPNPHKICKRTEDSKGKRKRGKA